MSSRQSSVETDNAEAEKFKQVSPIVEVKVNAAVQIEKVSDPPDPKVVSVTVTGLSKEPEDDITKYEGQIQAVDISKLKTGK